MSEANKEKFKFELLMLEVLEAHPKGITARELTQAIRELAEERRLEELVNSPENNLKRRVERNLKKLKGTYGDLIDLDDLQKPYIWRCVGSQSLIPNLFKADLQLALYLHLHQQRTLQLLPSNLQEKLHKLNAFGSFNLEAHFSELTQLFSRTLSITKDPIHPEFPPVLEEVHQTLLDALKNEQYLDITYQALAGEQELNRLLPLKLVALKDRLFLLAVQNSASEPEPILLALHRMTSAKQVGLCLNLSGFEAETTLRKMLGTGASSQALELQVTAELADYLLDYPLGIGMKLAPLAETASPYTHQLTCWIDLGTDFKYWLTQHQHQLKVMGSERVIRWLKRLEKG